MSYQSWKCRFNSHVAKVQVKLARGRSGDLSKPTRNFDLLCLFFFGSAVKVVLILLCFLFCWGTFLYGKGRAVAKKTVRPPEICEIWPGPWEIHPGTPVTPRIIFFGLFFGDNFSMMGLGGGSTDDTWINFPHQWIYNTACCMFGSGFWIPHLAPRWERTVVVLASRYGKYSRIRKSQENAKQTV